MTQLQTFKVLDHGCVKLLDFMGDDARIVQSARVSTGNASKTPEEDAKLIRYLLKNKHTSPFEKVRFEFYVKAPIFVARQWVRHRTASWNERSSRYSENLEDFYIPDYERVKGQGKLNRQGSEGEVFPAARELFQSDVRDMSIHALERYHLALKNGVSRELARILLPINFYTEWYWGIDLHNLFHFLQLRNEWHAQEEIQQYAQAIEELIQPIVPEAYSAWKVLL